MHTNPLKIYVAGLSWSTDERQLRDTFSPFGELDVLELVRDNFTDRSRGFAFITYCDKDAARAALGLDGHILDRRKITVSAAIERNADERRDVRGAKRAKKQLVVAAYSGKGYTPSKSNKPK